MTNYSKMAAIYALEINRFLLYLATMLNGIETINCGKLESNAYICIQFAKEEGWK